MLILKTLVITLTAAAVLGSAAAPVLAQSVPAAGSTPGQGTIVAANAPTELEYANADPLHGIYTRKPLIAQCGDQTVVGPMPTAAAGSLESQPGYNFLTDVDSVGMACRKAL